MRRLRGELTRKTIRRAVVLARGGTDRPYTAAAAGVSPARTGERSRTDDASGAHLLVWGVDAWDGGAVW